MWSVALTVAPSGEKTVVKMECTMVGLMVAWREPTLVVWRGKLKADYMVKPTVA